MKGFQDGWSTANRGIRGKTPAWTGKQRQFGNSPGHSIKELGLTNRVVTEVFQTHAREHAPHQERQPGTRENFPSLNEKDWSLFIFQSGAGGGGVGGMERNFQEKRGLKTTCGGSLQNRDSDQVQGRPRSHLMGFSVVWASSICGNSVALFLFSEYINKSVS